LKLSIIVGTFDSCKWRRWFHRTKKQNPRTHSDTTRWNKTVVPGRGCDWTHLMLTGTCPETETATRNGRSPACVRRPETRARYRLESTRTQS